MKLYKQKEWFIVCSVMHSSPPHGHLALVSTAWPGIIQLTSSGAASVYSWLPLNCRMSTMISWCTDDPCLWFWYLYFHCLLWYLCFVNAIPVFEFTVIIYELSYKWSYSVRGPWLPVTLQTWRNCPQTSLAYSWWRPVNNLIYNSYLRTLSLATKNFLLMSYQPRSTARRSLWGNNYRRRTMKLGS